jgi:hypothetical protein
MNQPGQEFIDLVCRNLALTLRRLTGRDVRFSPGELPVSIEVLNEINTALEAENAPDEKDTEA